MGHIHNESRPASYTNTFRERLPLALHHDLTGPVSKITRIQLEYLNGSMDLRTASLAKRMSWAAERETSRVEDRAYCLLCLFDVNMLVLYGEGREAFTRLQEEIVRRSSDQSIFCWSYAADENPDKVAPERRQPTGMFAPHAGCFKSFAYTYEIIIPVAYPFTLTSLGLKLRCQSQRVKSPFAILNSQCHLHIIRLNYEIESYSARRSKRVDPVELLLLECNHRS